METSLEIQQAIIQAIEETSNFHAALNSVLDNLCKLSRWDYGEAWIPCQEGTILELHSAFHITADKSPDASSALEQFRLCTKGFTFSPRVGLPGRVWSSQQAEWLSDASSESEWNFLRHHIARAFGVKTGFGVPVLANHRVIAVLVFFMLDVSEEDKHLTELVSTIALKIGDKLEDLFRKEQSTQV